MERNTLLEEFIAKNGLAEAERHALPLDASTRSYQRMSMDGRSLILMNAPPNAETAPCPAHATPDERAALGYNAEARLAGPNLRAFIAIASILRGAGIHAPEIYAHDAENGFALIEDLGDNLYATHLSTEGEGRKLYKHAIDVLLHLHKAQISRPGSENFSLLEYDETALLSEVSLLPQWYWSYVRGEPIPKTKQQQLHNLWVKVLSKLSRPKVLVLRDFHAENLLWLNAEVGLRKVGVIDFQDGLIGHAAYDLASLLEDARRDVSSDLASEMKSYYQEKACAEIQDFNCDQFDLDYAILAAQRNAKILGIFARLIVRDNKEKYKSFLPRVKRYFLSDMQHPDLKDLQNWFMEELPEVFS